MAAQSDGEYAVTLMTLLNDDCGRLRNDPTWRPIVIWEAEELLRQADSLDIPHQMSLRMRASAAAALVLVRSKPLPRHGSPTREPAPPAPAPIRQVVAAE